MNNKKRSFSRLIRNPDEDFRQKPQMLSLIAPIAAGFLAALLFIAVIAEREIFGVASSFSLHSARLGGRVMHMLAFSILPTVIVLKLLELYVSVRLRMTAHRDGQGQ